MADEDPTPLDEMYESLLRARQLATFLASRVGGSRRDRVESLVREVDAAVGTLHGIAIEFSTWNSVRRERPRKRDGFAFDVLVVLDASQPDLRRAYVVLPGLWQLGDSRRARFCIPGRDAELDRLLIAWPDGAVSEASVSVKAWRPAAAEFRLAAAARLLERTSRWKGQDERELLVDENALLEWDATGTPVPVKAFRARPAVSARPAEGESPDQA